MQDTIAAISTPIGAGGIAVIRMSGPDALLVADRVFCCRSGKPSEFASHTVHFGTIGRNGDLLDEVLLTVMRAPRTYTKEDVVEISCHGGMVTARTVLARCLEHGARLAEPGEFTKRAFLNGRIDLTQAEAVMEMIQAKTSRAQQVAVNCLRGRVSDKIAEARAQLLQLVAHIEAYIDFPEDEIPALVNERLVAEILQLNQLLQEILKTAQKGKLLRQGIAAVIVGRPNVGKSSLMNALLGRERCIVTPIPGTTRDSLEEVADIGGVPVRLIDTAGIRKARGRVEAIGVENSRKQLIHSDLVLHVIDSSRRYSAIDSELNDSYRHLPAILILNKCDLAIETQLPKTLSRSCVVAVSAKTGEGIEHLRSCIAETILSGDHGTHSSEVFVNDRQAASLSDAYVALKSATIMISEGQAVEITSHQLRNAIAALDIVSGKFGSEEILNAVFANFCIGK